MEYLKKHEDNLDAGLVDDALAAGQMALDIFSSTTLNAARMFISARKAIEEFVVKSRRLLLQLKKKDEKEKSTREDSAGDIEKRITRIEERLEALEKAVFGDDLRKEYAMLVRENIKLTAELEQMKREKERLEEKLRNLSTRVL